MQTDEFRPAEFLERFSDEDSCRDYLFRLKHPNGFACKRCSHREHFEMIDHRGGIIECKRCGYMESAKAGTVFHRSKLPLVQWFRAIYEITVTKGGVSALELGYKLGISYEPAWRALHKLRHAMGLRDKGYKLSGQVELDGAFFGRREAGTQCKVYLAVEDKPRPGEKRRSAGYARVEVVETLNAPAAGAFAEKNIQAGALIRTDGGTELHVVGPAAKAAHKPIVMKGDKGRLDKHLPWVHRLITNAKASINGTYHGVSPEYLKLYLDEHIYRFNRRWRRDQLQTRLLNACVAAGAPPLSYACR